MYIIAADLGAVVHDITSTDEAASLSAFLPYRHRDHGRPPLVMRHSSNEAPASCASTKRNRTAETAHSDRGLLRTKAGLAMSHAAPAGRSDRATAPESHYERVGFRLPGAVLHPSAWLRICGSLQFSSLCPPFHVLELLQSGLLLPMHKRDNCRCSDSTECRLSNPRVIVMSNSRPLLRTFGME